MANNISEDGRDRLQTVGHLASAVGHQIINAFSAIVSSAELIRITLDNEKFGLDKSPDVLEIVDTIVQNSLSASALTRRLIDFSHRSTDTIDERSDRIREPVDLNALIAEAVQAEGRLCQGDVAWRLHLDPVPWIPGDSAQLRMVFRQLLRNAREALPEASGTISIHSYTDKQNWIVIEIRDSGVGMSREISARAQEPFYTTKAGHAGVGLALARGIWRRHHGAFSIAGLGPAGGTLVRLSINPPQESAGLDVLLEGRNRDTNSDESY